MRWGLGAHKCLHLLSRVYIVQSVAEATKNTTSKVQRSFSGFELELCLPQIKFIFGLLKV